MRVFVTGNRGYIGVHLVDVLKKARHYVTGCDNGLYNDCEWEPFEEPHVQLYMDVADVTEEDLQGHDAICHLAAISNDPMGDLDPELTLLTNRDASVALARTAKSAGVRRFVFSSSCSVYGAGKELDLTEDDPLDPLTTYARSKIEAEELIRELASEDFSPTYLRNATAYGHSPMLRIDLVVNNLLGSALAYDQIRVKSDGNAWRPLIHCRDIARAFEAFLKAPLSLIHNQSFNVGANEENYQVRRIAELIQRTLPNTSVTFTGENGIDPRNYRVNFDKLRCTLPHFRLEYDLQHGIRELCEQMSRKGFSPDDFEGDQFIRLRMFKKRHAMTSNPKQVS